MGSMSVPLNPKSRFEAETEAERPMGGLGLKALAHFPQDGTADEFEERKRLFMVAFDEFVKFAEREFGARFVTATARIDTEPFTVRCVTCSPNPDDAFGVIPFRVAEERDAWAKGHSQPNHKEFAFGHAGITEMKFVDA